MKKFLVIALSAVLVLALAGVSFAANLGVETSGDAYFRGVWQDDSNDTGAAFYKQRVRVALSVNVAEDVWVKTRLRVSEGNWDGASSPRNTQEYKMTDYAYLQMPLFGGTLAYGTQVCSWGNKLAYYNGYCDRAKWTKKSGDTTFGVVLQKDNEGDVTGNINEGDKDGYYVLVIQNLADGGQVGGIIKAAIDDTAAENNQTWIDVYFKGIKAGNLTLSGEISSLDSDNDDDANVGAFIAADMPMDNMNLHFAFATAMNGFTADNDFKPTVFVGTDNTWAITDLGDSQTTADDTAYSVLASIKYPASDMLTYGAALAYHVLSDEADDATVTELDVTASYKIADNVTFNAGLGYGSCGDDVNGGDAITVVYHSVDVSF